MPLYDIIKPKSDTQILIWKITETFEDLKKDLILKPESQFRLNNMRSIAHQKGYLSVRQLLKMAGLSDADLYYDNTGKPFLNTKQNISISHSHEFSVIVVSPKKIGIDIELCQDKIKKIATKFVGFEENYIQNEVVQLTIVWAIKEAVFKIMSQTGISFKTQLLVEKFDITDKKTNCIYKKENTTRTFEVFFKKIEHFVLAYAFEK
jgi:4'-phosphopantetheinyl transferase